MGENILNFLYDSLIKYRDLDFSSFHTPGHKGQKLCNEDLFSLDFTELPATDSLFEANGIIKTCEKDISRVFRTKRSIISCGGNTLAIQTMIKLVYKSGHKLICDRLCHRSVVSTMALLGIEPVWLIREKSENGLPGSIKPENIEKILKNEKNICGIFLTSPNYYGRLLDIKKISEVAHKYSVPLLVDNAHGSHLMFLKENLHPLYFGADLSADSFHKTLPVLTGGAVLHINNEKHTTNAKNAMALFGSTSPPYPTMASIGLCCKWLGIDAKKKFEILEDRVNEIKILAENKGFFIPKGNYDPIRLTLGTFKMGISGFDFREHLHKFKIEPEFCDENYVIFIITPFNTERDLKRLENAILSTLKLDTSFKIKEIKNVLPGRAMSLREAILSEPKDIQAKKEIATEIVTTCPPGVPSLMPGEVIDKF